jgi:hypothetical protein
MDKVKKLSDSDWLSLFTSLHPSHRFLISQVRRLESLPVDSVHLNLHKYHSERRRRITG